MHVRIAWEIYNHQQKQKGGVDKKDNPLVPSTSSSLSSPSINKATPTTTATPSIIPPVPSSASIAAGHKRPSSGQPDFMHKRKATDADLLRSQLFAPPRPPGPPPPPAATPGHLDHALSNHLLPRPPYMSPFGPTPLRKSILTMFSLMFENYDYFRFFYRVCIVSLWAPAFRFLSSLSSLGSTLWWPRLAKRLGIKCIKSTK